MTLSDSILKSRAKWRYRGQERPPFALPAGKGQESVWDYPRPPAIAPDAREVIVRLGEVQIARSTRAIRILETASPPTFYLPPEDIHPGRLEAADGTSLCEWKGQAAYWSVVIPGRRLERVAWSYPDPFSEYEAIRGYVSFYPAALECTVDGIRALPQPGHFYGGWVTPEVIGPFKGEPGSHAW
jgi:uncharacterized protein (DUF427 family)